MFCRGLFKDRKQIFRYSGSQEPFKSPLQETCWSCGGSPRAAVRTGRRSSPAGPGPGDRLFPSRRVAWDSADLDISAICERTPEISWLIEAEEVSAPDFPENAARWLEGLKLGSYRPERTPGGAWRATLPRSAFGPGAALSLVTVGSFVVRGRDILNVWCDDVGIRRRTLLERVDFYLSYRANPDRADTEALVSQLARLLDLGGVDLPEVWQMAIDGGRGVWPLSWPASAKDPRGF